MGLTAKQLEVYEYILNYTREFGVAPTQREIKEYFGLRSFGSVQKYLKYLQEQNLIDNEWNSRRGIQLVDQPKRSNDDIIDVPILGKVAAGNPIEAIENSKEVYPIPKTMLKGHGTFFGLNVVGDSMIEDGILEGDLLICRHEKQAKNGERVIAIVENEATVKFFEKNTDHIKLIPANHRFKPIVVNEGDFRLAGIVVALIRSF